MENKTSIDLKIKNQFTAYLLMQIRGKRRDYIKKIIQKNELENTLNKVSKGEPAKTLDDYLEQKTREELLINETQGIYPDWNQMMDYRLIEALMKLRKDEKEFIYQHVFEERGFEEMSLMNGLPSEKIKNIYYYAIRKIRNWMGGSNI